MEVVKWRELYTNVLNGDEMNTIEGFLDPLLEYHSKSNIDLGAIGYVLKEPLKQVKKMAGKYSRIMYCKTLQLQVICRLLYCCNCNESKIKRIKKEICDLLDRVAFNLEALNPPTWLEDSDDRSSFQIFLVDHLMKRLDSYLPEIISYLQNIYEIDNQLLMSPQTMKLLEIVGNTKLSPCTVAINPKQLLSALREEKPLKRKRSLIADTLKEMEFPTLPKKPMLQNDKENTLKLSDVAPKKRAFGLQLVGSTKSNAKVKSSSLNVSSTKPNGLNDENAAPNCSFNSKVLKLAPQIVRQSDISGLSNKAIRRPLGNVNLNRLSNNNYIPDENSLKTHHVNNQQLQKHNSFVNATLSSPSRVKKSDSVVTRTPDRRPGYQSRQNKRILVVASPPIRKTTRPNVGTFLKRPMLR